MDTTASLNGALSGRYEIEREVGQGGMATVYLARDVRHSRHVALKVLHPDLAAALGAERFLAEIRTTANLQHPHILPLHDSGEADGHLFYVMPYVEGETLRARLQREQLLPVEDAVRLAREVLSALDYAHRHGVVHRDIKPENILLHDGSALVADFGISLAVTAAGGPRMTQTGLSLGTPSYMSPEQAMGDRVIDGRADIYATGATLYEMLIGEPPFTGPTSQAVVARLLTEEPRSLAAQRKLIPQNVDAAVRKALQKLPADRFVSAAEMSSALVRPEFALDSAAGSPALPSAARRRNFGLIAAVGLTAATVGALVGITFSKGASPAGSRVSFSFEADYSFTIPIVPVISPDGSRIVYAATDSIGAFWLFVRSLDNETPVRIEGTRLATRPVFSPDGRQIAFIQESKLKRVSLDGGGVTTIMPLTAPTPDGNWLWASDSAIYETGRTIRRISLGGGVDTISSDSNGVFAGAALLPDHKTMIGAEVRGQVNPQLVRYSMSDRTPTALGLSGTSPTVVDGGYLLYADLTGTLFAVRIDLKRGTLLGKPAVITTGVRLVQQRALYAASRNGTIVYVRSGATPNSQLVMVDRAGKGVALPVAGKPYRTPRFSPDGRRLAMTISRGDGTNNGDVWTYDFASERVNRLTFDGLSISPSWKPDGRTITFAHRELGKPDEVYNVPVDASVTAQHYFTWAKGAYEAAYTRDGKRIIYRVDGGVGGRDVLIAPVDSPTAVRPLVASPFEEYMIALSPDDKWLAYVSGATGRPEVYLRRVDGASGIWPVSRTGGTDPRWGGGADTHELLFRNKDTVTSVPLMLGDEARIGQPRALFAATYASQPWDTDWDVSPDGKRFVFVREPTVSGTQRMVVLMNWVNGVH